MLGSGTSTSVLIATIQKGRIAQASCEIAFFGYVWRTIFLGHIIHPPNDYHKYYHVLLSLNPCISTTPKSFHNWFPKNKRKNMEDTWRIPCYPRRVLCQDDGAGPWPYGWDLSYLGQRCREGSERPGCSNEAWRKVTMVATWWKATALTTESCWPNYRVVGCIMMFFELGWAKDLVSTKPWCWL